MMGSSDPFLYQLWLFVLQWIADGSPFVTLLGCGLLCAAMPYAWYRTLRELLPERWALIGGLIIGVTPSLIAIYAYFVTETLLMTLMGFAFWQTLRAKRMQTAGAFALACTLWVSAMFTRLIAAPMALYCLIYLWLPQPRKLVKGLIGVLLFVGLAIPAGLHTWMGLRFFAPLGNPFISEIYRHSGMHDITIQFGNKRWQFGSPSYYNPTFSPFSRWTTDRVGTFNIVIVPASGRASWVSEDNRAVRENSFPRWKSFWENGLYLLFGQPWPYNDPNSLSGWLSVWSRWIWPAVFLMVAVGALTRCFRGEEWLLPICAMGMLILLMVQTSSIIEARYRTPIDPIFLAAAVIMIKRWRDSQEQVGLPRHLL